MSKEATQFKKGHTGRPVGFKNKKTIAREEMLREHAELFKDKLIEHVQSEDPRISLKATEVGMKYIFKTADKQAEIEANEKSSREELEERIKQMMVKRDD